MLSYRMSCQLVDWERLLVWQNVSRVQGAACAAVFTCQVQSIAPENLQMRKMYARVHTVAYPELYICTLQAR